MRGYRVLKYLWPPIPVFGAVAKPEPIMELELSGPCPINQQETEQGHFHDPEATIFARVIVDCLD
jgi:hypothetical protein